MNAELPPAAPDVVAAAVESLTSRLRKKLDAAIETYAAVPVTADGGALRVRCGEDAEVTLTPGPSGAVTDAEAAVCSCLLAPRCLHRAAVLSACPVADAVADGPSGETAGEVSGATGPADSEATGPAGVAAPVGTADPDGTEGGDSTVTSPTTPEATPPTPAQAAAAAGLWAATAAVLAAGVPAAGAVPQAELL
ncbi:SWIM zinc finger family protein, partial [Streptomyces stelliscabiei]